MPKLHTHVFAVTGLVGESANRHARCFVGAATAPRSGFAGAASCARGTGATGVLGAVCPQARAPPWQGAEGLGELEFEDEWAFELDRLIVHRQCPGLHS